MSGIWPFNRNIFTVDEYAPAVVTDIVLNSEGQTSNNKSNTEMVDVQKPEDQANFEI